MVAFGATAAFARTALDRVEDVAHDRWRGIDTGGYASTGELGIDERERALYVAASIATTIASSAMRAGCTDPRRAGRRRHLVRAVRGVDVTRLQSKPSAKITSLATAAPSVHRP
jgi:hypothetical protein